MKKIISIIIVSIAALLIIFSGYVIIKYASFEPVRVSQIIISLGLFGVVILTIWAIDNLKNHKK
jgi:hypothetical protein